MSDTVISVEHVSKLYKLGLIRGRTLCADVSRWWAKLRGKPDPLLKVGQEDHGNREGEYMWALRHVSFQVKQGEVLGIIGRNGAGKSTLLKILSQITAPTSGQVKVKGRIASLLEVGTGFHPELTGRENIYLNGAILGMTRAEVGRKLDEVLAVGDAAFQKKCLGKMGEVAKGGRTVLFVSHNMAAVEGLCASAVVLEAGRVVVHSPTDEAIRHYLGSIEPCLTRPASMDGGARRSGNGRIRLTSFHVESPVGVRVPAVRSGGDVALVLGYACAEGPPPHRVDVGVSLATARGQTLCVVYSSYLGRLFNDLPPAGVFRCRIPRLPLAAGRYLVGARVVVGGDEADWPRDGVGYLDVETGDFYQTGQRGFGDGAPILLHAAWEAEESCDAGRTRETSEASTRGR